jgi:hypothetical protein
MSLNRLSQDMRDELLVAADFLGEHGFPARVVDLLRRMGKERPKIVPYLQFLIDMENGGPLFHGRSRQASAVRSFLKQRQFLHWDGLGNCGPRDFSNAFDFGEKSHLFLQEWAAQYGVKIRPWNGRAVYS